MVLSAENNNTVTQGALCDLCAMLGLCDRLGTPSTSCSTNDALRYALHSTS